MPLHLDYRPQSLDDFFGNDSLKASLKTVLEREDKPKAFMFTGPSGCGKTTLARIVAQEYGCKTETADYQELNIGQISGKDESGRIQREMHYAPMGSKVKAYCLDECQSATPAFQAGILKALEDTPRHVLFLLCTTDPHKLKRTIHTRCSRYEVESLKPQVMFKFLQHVLSKVYRLENGEVPEFPSEVINEIIGIANGCPREALVKLDQVIDMADTSSALAALKSFAAEESSVDMFIESLLTNDWTKCKRHINDLPLDANVEQIRKRVLGRMRGILLGKHPNPQAARVIHAFRLPFHDSGLAGLTYASYVAVTRMNLDMPY